MPDKNKTDLIEALEKAEKEIDCLRAMTRHALEALQNKKDYCETCMCVSCYDKRNNTGPTAALKAEQS